ncbi:MAG TPA: VOC family protein [Candidatus Paceibacterota bacterium]|nr:VOC family protein [Candidatus Paceibacterota bacterium]
MLKVTELAFCSYSVTYMPRARAFYENILNLTPTNVTETPDGKWVEYEFGNSALAITSSSEFRPSSDGCTAALEVEDFDDAIAFLKLNKVKFRTEPFETPVCKMALIYDPDSNTICIHKRKTGKS